MTCRHSLRRFSCWKPLRTWAHKGERRRGAAGGAAKLRRRQFVYGNYIDEPLAMISLTGGTALYYYQQDANYNVMALVNDAGVKVEGYIYDPYGRHQVFYRSGAEVRFWSTDPFVVGGASNVGNPYTFTGRRFDPETGLHYYRNRYYSSARERFISRDPIGVAGGINLYGYVAGRVMVDRDPMGLLPPIHPPKFLPVPNPTSNELSPEICEIVCNSCLGLAGAACSLACVSSSMSLGVPPIIAKPACGSLCSLATITAGVLNCGTFCKYHIGNYQCKIGEKKELRESSIGLSSVRCRKDEPIPSGCGWIHPLMKPYRDVMQQCYRTDIGIYGWMTEWRTISYSDDKCPQGWSLVTSPASAREEGPVLRAPTPRERILIGGR